MDKHSRWVTFIVYIFNHAFGFVFDPKWVKTTQHVLKCSLFGHFEEKQTLILSFFIYMHNNIFKFEFVIPSL